MSLSHYIENSEAGLVVEAHRFADSRSRGLEDLDEAYARYSPLFKSILAGESHRLAQKAGVSEKAAFLALMQLLEH